MSKKGDNFLFDVTAQWGKRHAKCLIAVLLREQDTSSTDVFKISKRHLFCKSKQCLTKALFRHLKKTSQRHLRSVFKILVRKLVKTFLR